MTLYVTGAAGMLGREVVREAVARGWHVVAFTRDHLDIGDHGDVANKIGSSLYEKAYVINCAGVVRGNPGATAHQMARVNAVGPHLLAQYAHRVIQVSTDCVFSGRKVGTVSTENDLPDPIDLYGRTKLAGELQEDPHLTIRGSFVGIGSRGLVAWLLGHPRGTVVPAYATWLWNGMTARAMARILLDLVFKDEVVGLLHVPGPLRWSKGELLRALAGALSLDLEFEVQYPVPSHLVLDHAGPPVLPVECPPWDVMLEELADDYRRYTGRA